MCGACDAQTDPSPHPTTPHPSPLQAVKPKSAGLALGQSVGNFFFKRGEVGALSAFFPPDQPYLFRPVLVAPGLPFPPSPLLL